MGRGEGRMGIARRLDALKMHEAAHIGAETRSCEKLRHKADIGERWGVAVTEGTRLARAGGRFLESFKTAFDPAAAPAVEPLLILPKLVFQVSKHTQILERMNVAGDREG
jgi:hypothetical protein